MDERVLTFIVAEDEALLRKNLVRKILACDNRLRCVGMAADGEDALDLVNEAVPDLLVTDIRMPVLDGLDLIERSLKLLPNLGVIIVSGFGDFQYAQQAIRLGVSDYLLKPIRSEKLNSALRRLITCIDVETNEINQEFILGHNSLAEYADAMEAWLVSHLRENVTLGTLCSWLRLKPSYAVKIFRKHKGTTPMRHLTTMRIHQACQLLSRGSELEIKQVASLVGYEDPLYFSRVFARETGISPSQWRESRAALLGEASSRSS